MSRFEYLSVLVSIVIALGIAEMTIAWARLIQQRARVTFSWRHAYWSLFTLFLMVQLWWGFWNFRTVETWSLAALLAVVAEALTLVLCALVFVPRFSDGAPLDMERVYRENARPFFLLGALLLVQLVVVDAFVLRTPLLDAENAARVPGIGLALLAAWSDSPRVHALAPAIGLLLLAGFLLVALSL